MGGRVNISVLSHECLELIGKSLEGNLRHEFRLMMYIQTVIDALYVNLIVFIWCGIKINLALILTKSCHPPLPKIWSTGT